MALKRSGPPARKTPLPRGTSQLKRTEMKRTPPKPRDPAAPRKPAARKPAPPDPLTPAIRAAVAQRSGGNCEVRAVNVCTGYGEHVHHRKLRRHNDHRPVNLLHVCTFCHAAIHANVAWSYERGWLVQAHLDPADIPALRGA